MTTKEKTMRHMPKIIPLMVFLMTVFIFSLENSNGVEKKKDAPQKKSEPQYLSIRSQYAEKKGIPKDYKALKNPLKPTAENIKTGERIYLSICVTCHGAIGAPGKDMPAGRPRMPQAPDLTLAVSNPAATDAYLFWTLTEGGSVIKTPMPSFKNFKKEERWKVILFLREKAKKGK